MPYVVSNAFDYGGRQGEKLEPLAPPRRPLLGGHCIAESGGSACAPKPALLLLRACALAGAVLAAVLALPAGALGLTRLHTVPFFLFLASTVAAAASSLRYVVARTPDASMPKYVEGAGYVWLANLAVPLHQAAFSAALFAAPLSWTLLRRIVSEDGKITTSTAYTDIAVTTLPLAVMLFDFISTMRHRYKLFYALFTPIYAGAFLAVIMMRDPVYAGLDKNIESAGRVSANYGIIIGWAVGATAVAYLLSLSLSCARKSDPLREELAFCRDTRVFRKDAEAGNPRVRDPEPSSDSSGPTAGMPQRDQQSRRAPPPAAPCHQRPPLFEGPTARGASEPASGYAANGPVYYQPPRAPAPASRQGGYDVSAAKGNGPYIYQPPVAPPPPRQPPPTFQHHHRNGSDTSVDLQLFPPVDPAADMCSNSDNKVYGKGCKSPPVPSAPEPPRPSEELAYPAYPAYPSAQNGRKKKPARQSTVSFGRQDFIPNTGSHDEIPASDR